jgi:hypothetical protein
MSNHYHLLLETPSGNLAQIMRHINGAYTTYFNVKWKRAGHLFQGRYQAILVEADAYALELSRYMHLNPVRAGMVAKPEHYPWSSSRSSIGHSTTPAWLKMDFILGYIGSTSPDAKNSYRQLVEDRLDSAYESPLKGTQKKGQVLKYHFRLASLLSMELAYHKHREVVSSCPGRREDIERKLAFPLERIQHHDLLLAHVDHHHGMDGIKPINRMKVNEYDGVVAIRHHSLQFLKCKSVFRRFDKPQYSCSIDSPQGVGAIRRAITASAQFTF